MKSLEKIRVSIHAAGAQGRLQERPAECISALSELWIVIGPEPNSCAEHRLRQFAAHDCVVCSTPSTLKQEAMDLLPLSRAAPYGAKDRDHVGTFG